ncbi:MAG: tetratricopeptide repeat protein, partial [Myxococcota bacterium]
KDLDRARSAFAKACDLGSSDGCERHELIDLPLKGCNDGNGSSCGELARIYGTQPNTGSDRKRAADLWTRACDLDRPACGDAGDSYRLGLGVKPDLDRAIEFYQRAGERDTTRRYQNAKNACDAGDGEGCVRLGDLYFGDRDGARLEPQRAREHYERGCNLGVGVACLRVVDRFATDRDRRPTAVAARYARAACEADEGAGCTILGNLIARGLVREDSDRMLDAYQRGCNGGDGEGCYRLGRALQAVPERVDAGAALVQRACALRFEPACGG